MSDSIHTSTFQHFHENLVLRKCCQNRKNALPLPRDYLPHRTLSGCAGGHSPPKHWNIWEPTNMSNEHALHICQPAYIIQIYWWIFYLTTCRCFIIAARTKTSLRATWMGVQVANQIKYGSKYLFVSAVAFWPLFGDLHCIDNSIKPMACLRKSS